MTKLSIWKENDGGWWMVGCNENSACDQAWMHQCHPHCSFIILKTSFLIHFDPPVTLAECFWNFSPVVHTLLCCEKWQLRVEQSQSLPYISRVTRFTQYSGAAELFAHTVLA
jgi:hypothetical protein